MNVDQAREEWQAAGDYDSACRLIRAQAARIAQLERELVAERDMVHQLAGDLGDALSELAAEKALSKDLDGSLQISEDIINAASGRLTKRKGEKWGLWYLDTIAASRAAYRKARGL